MMIVSINLYSKIIYWDTIVFKEGTMFLRKYVMGLRLLMCLTAERFRFG